MEKFQNIQTKFVNILLQNSLSEEEALRISSTFFLAWYKSQEEKNKRPDIYEKSVKEFLIRFKQNF